MKILLINQCFYPSVNATGQYLTDLALDLVRRHHEVTVLTGNRRYDNPSVLYAQSENYQGIRIIRISSSGFGRHSKLSRVVDATFFYFNLFFKLLRLPRQDAVVGLTTPPLVACIGNLFCLLKGGRFVYWVMDLNPDELIATGWIKEQSLIAKLLGRINRYVLRKSHAIVALDRFMKKRILERYGIEDKKVFVIPPWSQDESLKPSDSLENRFRTQHGLQDKFIVMYSGNHSACHPLETLLQAARHFEKEPDIVFCFLGGGILTEEVGSFKNLHKLKNILQFPYQPFESLSDSLSAADLHVVVMGDPYVGIIHPSKVYGILAVGKPFAFIGPLDSPIGELVTTHDVGHHVKHGDVAGLVATIEKARQWDSNERFLITEKTLHLKTTWFSQRKLSAELISLIE